MSRTFALLILASCFVSMLIHPPRAVCQESAVFACPMHPEIRSSVSGKCPRCEMKLVARGSTGEAPGRQAGDYSCPMHPDVRAVAAGKCSKCGMDLAPMNFDSDEYGLKLEHSPTKIAPGANARLRLTIFNPRTAAPVKQFAVMHEKLLHLFIISQDMASYQHIHPDLQADGSFVVDTVLPQPGHYRVYADFYPAGGTPQVLQTALATAGHKSDLLASQARLLPDATYTKVVDGTNIKLKVVDNFNNEVKIVAGRPVMLKYYLTDAATGGAVRDLMPYLGAWGHTLILSEDMAGYIHTHPQQQVYPGVRHAPNPTLGWEVAFHALLPHAGSYRIWSQFQRGEKLTTVSFTVQAARSGS